MNTQHFTNNDNQKFPLSTEALAFMQEQIKLAYGLTDLAGQNIIVKQSSATETGLVIYDGELLPLTGTPARFITIAQSTEQVSVEGRFTGTVRTTRIAVYASVIRQRVGSTGTGSKAAGAFTVLKSISTLMSELDEAKQHVMPKGSVIAWSGTCDCDHVPYGFIPCGAFFSVAPQYFGNNGAVGIAEQNKWRTKYESLGITVTSKLNSGSSSVGVLITQCNGVAIPDLTDRFIVQAGGTYAEGDTGGANTVTLTVNQMPTHNHDTNSSVTNATVNTKDNEGKHQHGIPSINADGWGSKVRGGSESAATATPSTNNDGTHKHSFDLYARGGGQAHENRPPFYALCYLIKVI